MNLTLSILLYTLVSIIIGIEFEFCPDIPTKILCFMCYNRPYLHQEEMNGPEVLVAM